MNIYRRVYCPKVCANPLTEMGHWQYLPLSEKGKHCRCPIPVMGVAGAFLLFEPYSLQR